MLVAALLAALNTFQPVVENTTKIAKNRSGECRFALGCFPFRHSILTPGMAIAAILLWKGPCAEMGIRSPLRIRAMARWSVRAGTHSGAVSKKQ